jgi:Tfp pilus assembly protein PilV
MQKFFKQKNTGFTRTPKFGVTPKGGGFTLVEALIAISIFTMSLLGIMSILADNITNIGYAKQKMTATYLAQEGIEYVRNIRDTKALSLGGSAGWTNFINTSIVLPAPSDTFYTRTISKITTNLDSDKVTITAEVKWPKGSVSFSEDLYNWIE